MIKPCEIFNNHSFNLPLFGRRIKVLIRAGSMGIEKVIKLVIMIFTWFYQKWIIKIKIKSANKLELRSASASVFGQM